MGFSASQIPPLRGGPSPGLWPPPFGLKGKRFYGQAKRLLYFRPNLEVLCRTSISKGGALYLDRVICVETLAISGPAAVGILMTVTPKRANDSAGGSFLGRRRCFGRALRCSLSVQYMLANEPGLGILCRMPTENLRVRRKLALFLHTKAPSFYRLTLPTGVRIADGK